MRQQSRPVDQSASRTRVNEESESSPPGSGASEASPLLGGGSSGTITNTASPSHQYATASATAVSTATANTNFTTTDSRSGPSIRARRSTSKSPSSFNQHFQQQQGETTSLTSSNQPMYQATSAETHLSSHSSSNNQQNILEGPTATDYTEITYHAATNNIHNSDNNVVMSNSSHTHNSDGNRSAGAQNPSLGGNRSQNNSNRVSRAARNRESAAPPRNSEAASSRSSYAEPRDSHIPVRRCGTIDNQIQRRDSDRSDQSLSNNSETHPPLLEIPEEVYAVRKSALQVLKPLTRTWVVVTVGFSLTVLFGMTRWTRLLRIPFWFILLPSWCSHVGLLVCHILSARALSKFISEANDSRQRPDSRDHLNRTEYLPLLQRSLKFGLKTGVLSFFVFVFEILIYVQLAWGSISLALVFLPLWLIVSGGIIDGIICKTQHFLRVICWILVCIAMTLTVLKVDYGMELIRWRVVVSPVVALLSVLSGTLIYIVYGHQIGYYQLTESQLTAGNLYSLAALICIVLFVVIGEVIPLSRPVEIETRIFIVVMAPLVVCLVGMGAWVVSRDEFGRLLLYGGQAAVHPMKLRWEANGWTSVQSKGVTTIPMFGEVSFRPLERSIHQLQNDSQVCGGCSACKCCTWYPYEDEEVPVDGMEDITHPYLAPSPAPGMRISEVLRFR